MKIKIDCTVGESIKVIARYPNIGIAIKNLKYFLKKLLNKANGIKSWIDVISS
jgi:hypothetical protein